ncbi:MAG TPA: T9SS type A sorting domain-containing protein, partial [Bacteroidia bacterium]|nr:T9SS type A sorting domain-containing protein [Bacteroidia bacterium]
PGGFTSGWLDNDLIKQTEDSLRLLYRKNPGEPWEIYPYYTQNAGNPMDKTGRMVASKIRKGEYVLGMYDKKLGTTIINPQNKGQLDIYPNPSQGKVTIEFDDIYNRAEITITDNLGRVVQQIPLYSGQKFIELDTNGWAGGVYFVSLSNGLDGKLVVE